MPPLGWKTARPEPISSGNENRSSSLPRRRWSRRSASASRSRCAVQLVLGRPRRAVDPLQLLVLLRTPPVGRRRTHQPDAVADQTGARQVGAAAQVLPDDLLRLATRATDVLVDAQAAQTDLDVSSVVPRAGRALEPDQLELVRLGGERGTRLVLGDVPAAEGLPLLHDPRHDLLEGFEVLRGEGGRDVEVVVEAVGDGRADAQPGLRVHLLDRLRQHVRGRVPQHREAVRGPDGHALDRRTRRQRGSQVRQHPVHAGDDDVASVGEQLRRGGALGTLAVDAVDGHGDLGHGILFESWFGAPDATDPPGPPRQAGSSLGRAPHAGTAMPARGPKSLDFTRWGGRLAKLRPFGLSLSRASVGDTGFEPVTSSV